MERLPPTFRNGYPRFRPLVPSGSPAPLTTPRFLPLSFNCAPDVERELTKIVLEVNQGGFDSLRGKFSRWALQGGKPQCRNCFGSTFVKHGGSLPKQFRKLVENLIMRLKMGHEHELRGGQRR
jgi:hypothetical protein